MTDVGGGGGLTDCWKEKGGDRPLEGGGGGKNLLETAAARAAL